MKYSFFFLLFWTQTFVLFGQHHELYKTSLIASHTADTVTTLTGTNNLLAVVVEFTDQQDVQKCFTSINQEEVTIILDPHAPAGRYFSQLFALNSNDQFTILLRTGAQPIRLHQYYSPRSQPLKSRPEQRTSCEEPSAIEQEIWRNNPTALPPPTVTPTETEVNHVIIHHSAGSNTNHNYQDVVRAIYLQHTQTNGWDDIGYNYLIAQDGTLFKGRDSQGFFDHDNVRGAHMCHKNNNTMAICLLGNYESISPPAAMLQTLDVLVAWKLNKENISPFGSTMHAIGPNSANLPDDNLPHIAGHQDGCQAGYTACPGKFVYEKLDSLRGAVNQRLNGQCAVGLTEYVSGQSESLIRATSAQALTFSPGIRPYQVQISNSLGHVIFQSETMKDHQVITSGWAPGLYVVHVLDTEGIHRSERFIKL